MPVNPLAAGVAAPDIAAIVAGELAALAADAHTLGARLSVGDVVQAIVLPSNGLTDLLDIGGLRVAAELPSSLLPGEAISVAVTGFSGDRINLQIVSSSRSFASESKGATDLRDAPALPSVSALRRAAVRPARMAPVPPIPAERIGAARGPVSPSTPPAVGTPARSAGTPAPAAGPPVGPAARASAPAADALAQAAGAPEQTPGARVPVATAPVPAAEAPAAPAIDPAAEAPAAPAIDPAAQAPVAAADAPGQGAAGGPAPPAGAPAPAAEALSRAAATLARAAGALARAAAAPPRPPAMLARAAETPQPAASSLPLAQAQSSQPMPAAVQPVEARLAAAHVIAAAIARPPAEAEANADGTQTARSSQLPSVAAPVVPPPVIEPRMPLVAPTFSAPVTAAAPALRGRAGFTEPVAFLHALRLQITPVNVASARLALALGNLPDALAALERVLANTTDPRLATLTTLTSFLARLDPRSPVLATQIAAFVDHVVTGVEAKIAQLLHASDSAATAAERTIAAPAAARQPPPAPQSTNPPPLAPEGLAIARAALDFDLKTQLLALVANGETSAAAASPKAAAFNAAIAGSLTAITALQLNAAATLNANPGGLSFTLPVTLTDGVAHARVRIDPDTPDGKRTPLDGDNFHIAFVLETRHLGTVAIDVMTVGRAVTLSVKTEGEPAQRVFGTALGELTARLEKLRYRVARADAVVAPAPEATESPSRSTPVEGPARLVDVNA